MEQTSGAEVINTDPFNDPSFLWTIQQAGRKYLPNYYTFLPEVTTTAAEWNYKKHVHSGILKTTCQKIYVHIGKVGVLPLPALLVLYYNWKITVYLRGMRISIIYIPSWKSSKFRMPPYNYILYNKKLCPLSIKVKVRDVTNCNTILYGYYVNGYNTKTHRFSNGIADLVRIVFCNSFVYTYISILPLHHLCVKFKWDFCILKTEMLYLLNMFIIINLDFITQYVQKEYNTL